jgi:hypothetical protein
MLARAVERLDQVFQSREILVDPLALVCSRAWSASAQDMESVKEARSATPR